MNLSSEQPFWLLGGKPVNSFGGKKSRSGDWDLETPGAIIPLIVREPQPSSALSVENTERQESCRQLLTSLLLPQIISPPLVCAQDPSKITATTGRAVSSGQEEKQSKSQQLRKVFQEYGAVAVSLHIGISLVSLGIFYTVVSSGVDMSAVLLKLGFKESLVQSKMAAGTSTFVVAYAIHKLFAPVRISITLVSVPFIVRYFRKVGFFKPPAAKP
nr:protein FAM210B, mitochondrial [Vulpes vulpes]